METKKTEVSAALLAIQFFKIMMPNILKQYRKMFATFLVIVFFEINFVFNIIFQKTSSSSFRAVQKMGKQN